ncbi:glycosyltransferase [Paenibacillus aceti]|uniref:Glycosyl transferase family 1 domain-containing protein n=1 Tax=Paenibacillus aceti TaxID=1820010 RepID=A0ABQ1VQQ9_9BACL|nr:glycosyltransferase [Paenibacillus aceti]GGF90606.1 hypothetical protein GCM10010913_10090 [Paenibacillus aceti]
MRPLRIGYVGGHSAKVNERVIDDQWTAYLGEYTDLVRIPPFVFIRLFGGSINKWMRRFPDGLDELGEGLRRVCAKYDVQVLYMNLPMMIPFLLMARNYKQLDLSILFMAHSVASPFWLKQWIGITPFLTDRDILLTSTRSCKRALTNIAPVYESATEIPLCIGMRNTAPSEAAEQRILAISRLENVKNIDALLSCFFRVREQVPGAKLTIAGEFTGSQQQISEYKQMLEELMDRYELHQAVEFVGPKTGEAKDQLFSAASLLVNFSTDPGETFGFNLLEAKVWGLPVVCTNWDGFQELVSPDEDGLLVDCSWNGEKPCIDLEQAAQACVRLLTDSRLQRQLSEGARKNALLYDYRVIMPKIVQTVEAHLALSGRIENKLPLESVATTPLRELPHIYDIERLKPSGWLHETPLSILSLESAEPLAEWMSRVKPLIRHFAGEGMIYAQH